MAAVVGRLSRARLRGLIDQAEPDLIDQHVLNYELLFAPDDFTWGLLPATRVANGCTLAKARDGGAARRAIDGAFHASCTQDYITKLEWMGEALLGWQPLPRGDGASAWSRATPLQKCAKPLVRQWSATWHSTGCDLVDEASAEASFVAEDRKSVV